MITGKNSNFKKKTNKKTPHHLTQQRWHLYVQESWVLVVASDCLQLEQSRITVTSPCEVRELLRWQETNCWGSLSPVPLPFRPSCSGPCLAESWVSAQTEIPVSSGLCSSAWTPQREKYLFLTRSQKFKHSRLSPICSLLSYQHPSIWLPLFCVLPWGTADTAGISPRAISPPAARRRARLPSSILAGHHSLVSSVKQLEDRCSARDTLLSNGRLYVSLQGDSTLATVVTSFSPYLRFSQVFPVFSYSLSPLNRNSQNAASPLINFSLMLKLLVTTAFGITLYKNRINKIYVKKNTIQTKRIFVFPNRQITSIPWIYRLAEHLPRTPAQVSEVNNSTVRFRVIQDGWISPTARLNLKLEENRKKTEEKRKKKKVHLTYP